MAIPCFLENLCNCTAANHHLPLIQRYGLAGGHSTLGRVKDHLCLPVFFRINGGGLLNVPVSGLGGDPDGLGQFREGDPVPVICPKGSLHKCFVCAYGVRASVDAAAAHNSAYLIDSFVLGNPHESIFGAIKGANDVREPQAGRCVQLQIAPCHCCVTATA